MLINRYELERALGYVIDTYPYPSEFVESLKEILDASQKGEEIEVEKWPATFSRALAADVVIRERLAKIKDEQLDVTTAGETGLSESEMDTVYKHFIHLADDVEPTFSTAYYLHTPHPEISAKRFKSRSDAKRYVRKHLRELLEAEE